MTNFHVFVEHVSSDGGQYITVHHVYAGSEKSLDAARKKLIEQHGKAGRISALDAIVMVEDEDGQLVEYAKVDTVIVPDSETRRFMVLGLVLASGEIVAEYERTEQWLIERPYISWVNQ